MANIKFKCSHCGSEYLGFQTYVKCITPAHIQDDEIISYGDPVVDTNDETWEENGFCCGDCGERITYLGFWIRAEKNLIIYLEMNEEDRQKRQNAYELNQQRIQKLYEDHQKQQENNEYIFGGSSNYDFL